MRVVFEIIRISDAKTMPAPPPKHNPRAAQITGFNEDFKDSYTGSKKSPLLGCSTSSLISCPAQKSLPLARTSITQDCYVYNVDALKPSIITATALRSERPAGSLRWAPIRRARWHSQRRLTYLRCAMATSPACNLGTSVRDLER